MSTERIFTDREALEHFRETHPEFSAIRSIAEIAEEPFVQRYATTAFNGNVRQARRVHKTSLRPFSNTHSLTTFPQPFWNISNPSLAMTDYSAA